MIFGAPPRAAAAAAEGRSSGLGGGDRGRARDRLCRRGLEGGGEPRGPAVPDRGPGDLDERDVDVPVREVSLQRDGAEEVGVDL